MKYILSIMILATLGLCSGNPAPATELTRGELITEPTTKVDSAQADAFIIHYYNNVSARRPYSKKECQDCPRESGYKIDQGVMYSHSTVTFFDNTIKRNVTLTYDREKQ